MTSMILSTTNVRITLSGELSLYPQRMSEEAVCFTAVYSVMIWSSQNDGKAPPPVAVGPLLARAYVITQIHLHSCTINHRAFA